MPRKTHSPTARRDIATLPVLDREHRRYLEALVPADRVAELAAYEWQLRPHGKTGGQSVQALVGKRTRHLHRLIIDAKPPEMVAFRDGDPLHCVPANLVIHRPVTWSYPEGGFRPSVKPPRKRPIRNGVAKLPVLDRENRRYLDALVPADRVAELEAYEWQLRPHKRSGEKSVQAWEEGRLVYLHRLVARAERGQGISFRDGNALHCLPANLVVETRLGARCFPEEGACELCGDPLPPSTSPRKRLYCSDSCRQRRTYLRRRARRRAASSGDEPC